MALGPSASAQNVGPPVPSHEQVATKERSAIDRDVALNLRRREVSSLLADLELRVGGVGGSLPRGLQEKEARYKQQLAALDAKRQELRAERDHMVEVALGAMSILAACATGKNSMRPETKLPSGGLRPSAPGMDSPFQVVSVKPRLGAARSPAHGVRARPGLVQSTPLLPTMQAPSRVAGDEGSRGVARRRNRTVIRTSVVGKPQGCQSSEAATAMGTLLPALPSHTRAPFRSPKMGIAGKGRVRDGAYPPA